MSIDCLAAELERSIEEERKEAAGFEKAMRHDGLRRLGEVKDWSDMTRYYAWLSGALSAKAARHRRQSIIFGIASLFFLSLAMALTMFRYVQR